MSTFSFGNINANSRKQVLNLKTYDTPLLADKSKVRAKYKLPIVILVEEQYTDKELKLIDEFLCSEGCSRYILLNALACEFSATEAKEGIIKFYKTNRSNFMDFIPYGSPIITSGCALYSLLMEDDIYSNYVNQLIFGKSNFWFSPNLTQETCHRVFPIASFKKDIFGFELYNKWTTGAVDSYKTKIAKVQIKGAIKYTDVPIPEYPELNKVFIESKEDFYNNFYLPNKDRKGELLAWDLETSGLHFFKDDVGCITLSFDGNTGYYIPFDIMDYDCKVQLDEIFKNNTSVMANGKFDIKHLWKPRKTKKIVNADSVEYVDYGFKYATVDEDIIQLGHTLDETRSNSLKSLTQLYTIYGGYERPLDEYKAKMKGEVNYLDIPEEILREYAVMDAICTWQVYQKLLEHVRELDKKYPNEFSDHGMEYYYRTFKMPAERMYAKIEYRGVYVDKNKLDNVRNIITTEIQNIKKNLSKEFNVREDFQWESGQQLGILLEKMGWEDLGRTKAGTYATGDYQISRWKKNHPEAQEIENFRSYSTLLNTFVGDETKNSLWADMTGSNDEEGEKGWSAHLVYHTEDNSWRMHPSFLSMMTDSGRSRCTSPNMQQVPTRGKFSKEIKSCISTPNNDNYYMVTVDYSALQMRLCGIDVRHFDKTAEGAEGIVETLLKGRDVDMHSNTAYNVFFKDRPVDVRILTIEQAGAIYSYLEGESVMTENRGEVFANDLVIGDVLEGIAIELQEGNYSWRTEHRVITLAEFKAQKGFGVYKKYRQIAKSINFGMLFGGSEAVLSANALETNWTLEEVETYIKEFHCEKELEEVQEKYRNYSIEQQKYIASASRMRRNFLEAYPGLVERCEREVKYAKERGYCRSVFGGTRNLIELLLEGIYDDKNESGRLRNLENIAKNYLAQQLEACIRGRAMREIQSWFERNDVDSFVWNEIHDSIDFWINKHNAQKVLAHIKHVEERKIPELQDNWIPLPADCEISDLTAKEHNYYKGGASPESYGLQWTDAEFLDPDPFGVELSKELETEYFDNRKNYYKEKGQIDPLARKITKYRKENNI